MDPLFYFYISVIFLTISIPFCVWFLKVLNSKPIIVPKISIEETEETNNDDSSNVEMREIPNANRTKDLDLDNVSWEVMMILVLVVH